MVNIITCAGNLIPAKTGPTTIPNVLACDTGWQIVPYVEPTDSTMIYAQLVALNEFDPEHIAWIIVICLSTFIVGFSTGVVLKLLRRL